MRVPVAIIGAGPAGMLLSHLLACGGVESIVIEARSEQYVLARIRAGILEHASVELLGSVGLGTRLANEGLQHRGVYLHSPEGRHHIDFVDLVDRSVWVYGQTEVQKDLVEARTKAGQQIYYQVTDVALDDLTADHPSVGFIDHDGCRRHIKADVVVGCDGSFGPSRVAVPNSVKQVWEKTYPYSWLGVMAAVPPSTDELIYAWHPDGFAMHSMRSSQVSRLYLQVPNDTQVSNWPHERIWDALAERLGHTSGGWELRRGPVSEVSVLPMRSYVQSPMRYGRLFLAGDAAHIVPPTGAKGLNLAIADVALLAPALVALLRKKDTGPADAYSDTALRRVWRCTYFSWWMTRMLHIKGDAFDAELQKSQLRWLCSSTAAATGFAENYAGLPLDI